MSILVNKDTRVLIQGITGQAAQQHTEIMISYGTRIVAGVRPGAGGKKIHGIKVFNTVAEAAKYEKINASILFVPAAAMKQASFEALEAKIPLLVLISEHVPLHDTMEIIAKAEESGSQLIGPNTPGLIDPAQHCKIGFMPSRYYVPGPVGVASRSGTLTYEIVSRLTTSGIGQTTCIGVGGDRIVGSSFVQIARMFEDDPNTKIILIIGEVGGSMEEELAELVKKKEIMKPVVAYIAGRTAPKGKRMGHAGAIIASGRGSIESKLSAFESAGIPVATLPQDIVRIINHKLNSLSEFS